MSTYSVRENIDTKIREEFKEFSDMVAHLLFHRGIKKREEADAFLNPDFEKGTYDPYLLADMQKAVTRILKAVEDNEKICIYSDYDADGIPGAVVLHDFFVMIGHTNFTNYIPDRSLEGFGLNKDALHKIKDEGAQLIITIDCGIAEVENIKFANSLGLTVVVTDHHLPGEVLPEAYAIINPKISPEYPDKMLCGAGVVFKLVQGILKQKDFGLKAGSEKWLLDMVGIATLSDMVPLVNENRVLAYFGLIVLRKSRRIGLQKLLKKIKVDQRRITEDDVGFMITPRINAASRMGVSYDAFHLFTTQDEKEAGELVEKLEKANMERKNTTAHLTKEVKKHIDAKYSPYFQNKIIVAGDPTWKPSLLGLVANSIAEKESKPVFLWGRDNNQEIIKGSCRSVGDISVVHIMSSVADNVLKEFGGHHLAGGFALSFDYIHKLDEALESAFLKISRSETQEQPNSLLADTTLTLLFVNHEFLKDVEKMAPFGIGNPKPVFVFSAVCIEKVTLFGKAKEHLRLTLGHNGKRIDAVKFFAPEKMIQDAESKKTVDILGYVERSFFLGREEIRIRIERVY